MGVTEDHRQEALDEALRQLEVLETQENERRRGADTKLGALQGTIGVIVTLVAGSASLTAAKPEPLTIWRFTTYIAFGGAIFFFVWAAQQVRKASDLKPLQARTPRGICRLLQAGGSKRTLVLDSISDYEGLIPHNQTITDYKLTWYRAAIENIIKGVYCLAAVPAILFLSILWGAGYQAYAKWQSEQSKPITAKLGPSLLTHSGQLRHLRAPPNASGLAPSSRP